MDNKIELSPRNATSFRKICKLKEDNTDTKGFWMLIDSDTVTIAKQRNGENCEWMRKIPRKDFNKLIDWYNKEQTL